MGAVDGDGGTSSGAGEDGDLMIDCMLQMRRREKRRCGEVHVFREGEGMSIKPK